MKLDQKEIAGGYRWFAASGVFGLCLATFLYWADETLTHSDKEVRLGKTLKEIRTAQHTIARPTTDVRLSRLRAVPIESTNHDEDHNDDHSSDHDSSDHAEDEHH